MIFVGSVANALAIVAGAVTGIFLRRFISERAAKASEIGLGLCSLAIGFKMAAQSESIVVFLLSISLGGAIGAALEIEKRLEEGAKRLQKRFLDSRSDRFALGLVNASVLYCTGAMAIVGSLQSGASENHEVLFTKSILDGLIGITLAAVYGWGVAVAAIPVLIYEGSLTLLSSHLSFLSEPALLKEVSGVGGVLIAMIGINLSGLKKVAVADFIPALVLAIVFGVLKNLFV